MNGTKFPRRDVPDTPNALPEAVIFAHLLNDFSGSPKVLSRVIRCATHAGLDCQLYVGRSESGSLTDERLPTVQYWYRHYPRKLLTLASYIASQTLLCAQLLRTKGIPRNATVYVNTLLPIGAAIYGALTSRRVIYHLHEVSISPRIFQRFLLTVVQLTAEQVIYVSEFHRQKLGLKQTVGTVIYNAIDQSLLSLGKSSPPYALRRRRRFRVCMLSALRAYKGVYEYMELARRFVDVPEIAFDLVANDEQGAIAEFRRRNQVPTNLHIHPRTSAPDVFYSQASLVVNLSRPDLCEETFGLTLLEAFAFGVPVIAPPVGGPVELVRHGQEGFLIDSRNIESLVRHVELLLANRELCERMSSAAYKRAEEFSEVAFATSILRILRTAHARTEVASR